MEVVICTPHGGNVSPDYYRHVLAMQGSFTQHVFSYCEIDMMIVGKARNVLVDTALITAPNADVLWFIDNDVLVPPHAGVLIEQAYELGIVSGLYFSRRPPYMPQMYRKAYEKGLEGKYWPLLEYPESGLMVVDAVGGGCLAVRKDIFLKMRAYHEEQLKVATEEVLHELRNKGRARAMFEWLTTYTKGLSPWFEFLDKKGEDLYFCERAKEVDQVIWVNVDVKCQHNGTVPIHEPNFLWLRDNGLIKIIDPTETPGADRVEAVVQGAEEEDEYTDIPGPGPEGVERSDDIQRPIRGVGVSSNISGEVPLEEGS